MTGHRPIVLAILNHQFHEHPTLDAAEAEALRLVSEKGVGMAVVYVPKRIVSVQFVTEHIRGNGRPESAVPVLKPARLG